ncbi:helix-turn-helix domain-containing protein [Kitasatospora sp. CB01950]|uniref:helix-turn-helix domain-containing protein n=1 Tax=Kitasatospora sp. CB01950 TaxID=1703930 RepID=UPI00093EF1F2|nr:helix-turn-helix domain-containing protein [Kitasatospora sp. CB01950]
MSAVAALVPHVGERGITLSPSRVHRPVSGAPERLCLPVPAALCDVRDCTPSGLIATAAENLSARRAVGADAPPDPSARRPERVRLTGNRPGGAVRPGIRCRQAEPAGRRFEGPICRSCAGKDVRTRGRCPGRVRDRAPAARERRARGGRPP